MSNRRFVLHNDFIRTNLLAFLQKIDLATTMEVIVRPFVDKRSSSANARLWALHTKAAEYVGCSPEDMHERNVSSAAPGPEGTAP